MEVEAYNIHKIVNFLMGVVIKLDLFENGSFV